VIILDAVAGQTSDSPFYVFFYSSFDFRNFGTPRWGAGSLPTVTPFASVTRCAQREHVHQLVSCARAKVDYYLSWCWMSIVLRYRRTRAEMMISCDYQW
jgi:hypothetical protein